MRLTLLALLPAAFLALSAAPAAADCTAIAAKIKTALDRQGRRLLCRLAEGNDRRADLRRRAYRDQVGRTMARSALTTLSTDSPPEVIKTAAQYRPAVAGACRAGRCLLRREGLGQRGQGLRRSHGRHARRRRQSDAAAGRHREAGLQAGRRGAGAQPGLRRHPLLPRQEIGPRLAELPQLHRGSRCRCRYASRPIRTR